MLLRARLFLFPLACATLAGVCWEPRYCFVTQFLADRTNGRAIATLLRLSSSSSVVCNVMYCG